MLIDGLKLLVLGMGIVLSFLVLLMWLIRAMGELLAATTLREIEQNSSKQSSGEALRDEALTAVIAAAIAAYRRGAAERRRAV